MSKEEGAFSDATDRAYMARAVQLAVKGRGWTNPNPMVGAVIVKDGRIIGEGYHERCGELHAERNALAACDEDPTGATLYVTLEPCCHWGKQPPCTQAVIDAGIAKVCVGSRDPNPLVGGKGNARLREAGIVVVEDVLEDECDKINPVFFHFIQTGKPLVVAKWAMTADGKISTKTGSSQWVSNEASRADVHEMRHALSAILVGANTVAADDPSLTARRDTASNQPLRVVVDSHLRISLESKLVRTAGEVPVLVATCLRAGDERFEELRARGVDVVTLEGADGRVDLAALVDELGSRGIDSVLVEGGGTVNDALFSIGLVDKAVVYVAPKVCGGVDALTPVGGAGVELMEQAHEFELESVARLGSDVKLSYICNKRVRGGER